MANRIAHEAFRSKLMTAADAAEFIQPGMNIGFAGFTGAGYPKEFPAALAERIKASHEAGKPFRIGCFTGASTAPELDGELAAADGVSFRTPYQSDPIMRKKINQGEINYVDLHLSHTGTYLTQGFLGNLDVAVVEVTAITADGELVPSSSVGASGSYMEMADKVILEVNSWQTEDLYGLHDIFYDHEVLPPNRKAIPILNPGDLIGSPTMRIDPEKVVAVIETNSPDRNSPFKPLDEDSKAIAGYLLDFLTHEVKAGRLPANLLPMQSGVGNVANAVLQGLLDSPFENLTSYTEVIQDGMVDLIDAGKVTVASATAFSLSPEMAERMNREARKYHGKIILRPQDVSNHPEVIRRLGVLACNGMIEADIYGNVNSTHVMGTRMMNGIGGSGDFTRNAYWSAFVSPSTAKGGAISAITPFVSHVDHTEHDTDVIITERGLADLRGLAPQQRAKVIIEKCAHPDFQPMLEEYFEAAKAESVAQHTPHRMGHVHDWHVRFLETGTMKES